MDQRVVKHAKVITEYCLYLKPGEKISIIGNIKTLPLMRAVYEEAIKLGALPWITLQDEWVEESLLKYGNDEQISYFPAAEITNIKNIDALLFIWGSENTRHLSAIPSEKSSKRAKAMSEWFKVYSERQVKGELRWCGTLFPTTSQAQESSMSLTDYEDFVYSACYIDSTDPVDCWRKIHDEQQRYVDYLDKIKKLRIVAEDTDITMLCEGRKWQNSDGHENFPSGEVFTSPIENSINGQIRFSYPGIYMGKEIEDIRLTFKDGEVVKATAAKGQELLDEILKIEGAKFAGEVAMGTNYNIKKFTKNILFDEKLGGTTHIALGRGFPKAGGKNVSDIHWDMLCDMKNGGEIFADGVLIYKDGKFLI